MVTLTQAIPALPVGDAAAAVAFYREKLGFDTLHHDGGFAVVCRDDAVLHLWESSDQSWRERTDLRERPVCSGAESFIAGTASCRILVDEVDELYEELAASDVLPPGVPSRCRRHRLRDPRVRDPRSGRESPHLLPPDVRVIRLGRISYVNMAPVFHRLEYDVDEVVGVPTELNRMLLDGQIDIAPISSIEYARHADTLRLLPRLCVSSEGAVDSIQLVTRMPLGRVRSVAVTPESATSVVLTRVLLPSAEIRPFEDEADAKLLIGDAALKSAFEDPTPHYDLGRLWLEKTGLPMVFAVWAAPEPLIEGISDLEHALVASVRLARSEPELLAYEASARYGYPAGFLARYFEKLRYSFGPRERAGFYTFLEMARDVGELDHVPELRFARDSGVRL